VLLTDTAVDGAVDRKWLCLMIGVALVVLPRVIVRPHSVGMFTGLTLIAFGVFAGALRHWRHDRGLWMFAVLLIVVYGPVYLYYQCQSVLRVVHGGPPNAANVKWLQWCSTIDACIGMIVFGLLMQFLVTVAIRNFQLSASKL
jgi:hypothetical protein